MKVIAIAAVGRNGVIGDQGRLPWSLPEDLRFFRSSTLDQIVLMGRKTFDSLGKALPKRENSVITRDLNWNAPGVRVFHEISAAITFYRNSKEHSGKDLFVIGGAEIYHLATPILDEIWLTEIAKTFQGDVFFKGYSDGALSLPNFEKFSSKPGLESDSAGCPYVFSKYRRVP